MQVPKSSTLIVRTGSKRYASPQVAELIRFVNLIPAETELPTPYGKGQAIIDIIHGPQFKRFRRVIGPMEPEPIFGELFGPCGPQSYNRLVERYELLRLARECLRAVAQIGEILRKRSDLKGRYSMPSFPRLSVSAVVNERGTLHFDLSPILKILSGIEPERVRRCPMCGRLFWAGRKDTPCCSSRCGGRRRVQKWRERFKERYIVQRYQKAEAGSAGTATSKNVTKTCGES